MRTVKELIEELSKYPPDALIVRACEMGGNYRATEISISPAVMYTMEKEQRIVPKDWYWGKNIVSDSQNPKECLGIF